MCMTSTLSPHRNNIWSAEISQKGCLKKKKRKKKNIFTIFGKIPKILLKFTKITQMCNKYFKIIKPLEQQHLINEKKKKYEEKVVWYAAKVQWKMLKLN